MRKYWGIIAYIQLVSHQPFVGVYEYALDREFKESFIERVIFKDEYTTFDVTMYEIRIWTVRPKNTINVFLRETDWILSKCTSAGRRLYLPLLREEAGNPPTFSGGMIADHFFIINIYFFFKTIK